jgi:hypothetical protein
MNCEINYPCYYLQHSSSDDRMIDAVTQITATFIQKAKAQHIRRPHIVTEQATPLTAAASTGN